MRRAEPIAAPSIHSACSPGSLFECQKKIEDLLETPLPDLERQDLATLNLLCAPILPGSESLDIPRCIGRMDRLTAFVRERTELNRHRFASDPVYGHCEPMWRMAMLVTLVKRDFGACYSPVARADFEAGIETPFSDSREIFIHGLLDDNPKRRWGTCTSIPVLMTAIARRLGYPVRLAVTRTHVYARWDDGALRFNIETSNPMGMTSLPDSHYRALRGGLTPDEERSGYYLRGLCAAEEFTLFLQNRVWCLRHAARFEQCLLWAARALQFSPDEPHFALAAHQIVELTLKQRARCLCPADSNTAPSEPAPFVVNAGPLLAPHERSLFLTIMAHFHEAAGRLDEARRAHEDACRQNFHGNNEQRDFQRFLRKHGLATKVGPLLPPVNLGLPRWFKLPCKPAEEADYLRRLIGQFERDGEILKARDALRDLYLFDPADGDVFQRARALERHPLFQPQLKTYIEERRRAAQETSRDAQKNSKA